MKISLLPKNQAILLLGIVYLVGVLGTIFQVTRPLMLTLTPVNLLLSAFVLTVYHPGDFRVLLKYGLFAAGLGLAAEVIGVQTGLLFGQYTYGETLGFKIFGVPLIIGVNWFLLSYAFFCMGSHFGTTPTLRVVIAAVGMTLLDFLIEPVAIQLDYWQWEGGQIPVSNFIGWLFIALIIQGVFVARLPKINNPIALPLIIYQALYFAITLIVSQL